MDPVAQVPGVHVRPYAHIPDDELRRRSKAVDDHLGSWLDLLRRGNPGFKRVLAEAVELDLEIERRAQP